MNLELILRLLDGSMHHRVFENFDPNTLWGIISQKDRLK